MNDRTSTKVNKGDSPIFVNTKIGTVPNTKIGTVSRSAQSMISIVLPVYNEGRILPLLTAQIIKIMQPSGYQYEMIFVNDGSRDDSGMVLDQLAASSRHIRVVHLSRNFGHQAAVHAGLAHARGDAVVIMDSDLQDNPEAILQMIAHWREGCDVVYALRRNRKEGKVKKLLFTVFHRLLSRVASVSIPADAGNFGLIDRRVARTILSLGERDRYFPGLRSWVGMKQMGIEVERNARYDDRPRVSLRGLFRLAKSAIFSFSAMPLMIFHVIGMAAAAVFVGLGAYALYCKLFTSLAIPGWTSYMLTGSFFGALNAMGIAILGEYVIRIYDQVRARPLFLVDRTVNMKSENSDESAEGDKPYLDLLLEAMNLLETGKVSAPQPENAEESAFSREPMASANIR
jgi:polyisoprenyl-phosphate glycosyltransferase